VTEVLMMTWLALVGLALLAPAWDRLPPIGLVAAALPTGVAGYVLVALGWIAADLSFSTVTVLAATSGVAVAVASTTLWRDLRSGEPTSTAVLASAAVVVVATAAGAWLAQVVHLTRFTSDSLRYLLTAEALEQTGSPAAASVYQLRMGQLVVPLLHTGGIDAGAGYSPAIIPLLAASGLLAAGWLAWEGMERAGASRRWRWWLLGTAAALVLTTNRVGYHIFYVNGHMTFAVVLVIGVGLGWLAVARHHWALLWPAGLMFGVLPALRPEAVIVGTLFLVPFLVEEAVPMRARWGMASPFLAATVLWDGVIWPRYAADADLALLGPVRGNLLAALGVAAGLALLAAPPLRRFARWGPLALFAGLVAYLAVKTVRDPDVLRAGLAAFGANIAIEGLWGMLWLVLPLLAVGALLVAPPPFSRLWFAPLGSYGVALLAFAYLRGGGYRVGTGDSGSRMLLHVVLVAIVAVIHSAGVAVAHAPEPTLRSLRRRR
jgi:hypothetical protein